MPVAVFPDAFMAELLAKNDIVALVSQYVDLRPKGGRMWGCCPFHSEKTPSFSVIPDKQFYYCFGCHAGGGTVQFVMEMEKLSYVEAIKHLAERVGMELPDEVDDDKLRNERAHRDRLYAAHKEAARFYHEYLMGENGAAAREYLKKRGVDGHSAKRFGIGLAPDAWDGLMRHLTGKGFTKEELVSGGLAVSGKRGDIYDAFRGRVIFPIIAANGRVTAFGARAMGSENPKYINTGDTPIYNKRSNLYALNMQRGKRTTELIMVEGYMDVISLFAGGVENAVASLGTALTQQQARLVKRYAERVYISYDGDSAGQNATLRGLDILAREGLEVRVIGLPGGMDPDDFIRREGREAYLKLKDKALPLNAFKLGHIAGEFDLSTEDGREGFARKACAFAAGLEPVERERYTPEIARKAGLSEETVKAQCGLTVTAAGNSITKIRNNRDSKPERKQSGTERFERTLLAAMLKSREAAFYAIGRMTEEKLSFSEPAYDAVAEALAASYAVEESIDERLFIAQFAGTEAELVGAALESADAVIEPMATVNDCMREMLKRELARKIELLSAKAESGGEDRAKTLYEIDELKRRLRGGE